MSEVPLAILLSETHGDQLNQLAKATGLPLINEEQFTPAIYPYTLQYQKNSLCLQESDSQTGPVLVDFLAGKSTYRRLKGGGELIVKAVTAGVKQPLRVWDVTAGLGKDSFVLASAGCEMTLIERSQVIAALLADGLSRAKEEGDEEELAIIARMQLKVADARDLLRVITDDDKPDVIYLDPMFPVSKKSAQVKKEMRSFHYVVGEDATGDELLAEAIQRVKYRVVVKRPKKSVYLGGKAPSFSLEGKAVRFDVYAVKALNKRVK